MTTKEKYPKGHKPLFEKEKEILLSEDIYFRGYSKEDVKQTLKIIEKRLKRRDLRMTFTHEEWKICRMFIIKFEEALDKKITKIFKEEIGK